MENVNVSVSWLWLWCLSRNKDSGSQRKRSIYFRLDLSFSPFLVAQAHMPIELEDNPHPGTLSQVGDTSRPITASSTAESTSENTQQKQQISDLVTVVEEKLQALESESGHAMTRYDFRRYI